MASESIRFDFLTTGGPELARQFKSTGDNAAAAARGAKVLQDAIKTLGDKENRTAAESANLARALRLTGNEEDRMAAKAVAADAAIRRLDDAIQEEERNAAEAAAANRALGDSFGKLADKAGGGSLKGALAALTPALIPLAGGIAAGVAAVGVSFGAAAIGAGLFGAAAKSVLSGASSNLAKLQALQVAADKARTTAGRKAALQQIADLKGTWSAGYLNMIDALEKFKAKWTSASQAIAVPALTTWIHALTDAIGFLKPAVLPVAAVFTQWGQALDRYFKSAAGSAEVTRLATAFGRFSASQLKDIGVFVVDIGRGVFSLARDLAGHNIDFGTFGKHLDEWGAAFARWSGSAAARQDVNKFLAYIGSNGPVVAGLLKNLGKDLAVFAPGLSGVGALELRLVSDFLGFLARTPKSIARPLVETAGALLLLQKTGVLKVGIKIVGAAAKWLTGGAIDIGGGAAAAGEIRAAFTSGGAAAAAEIRAALAGGGAVAGAEGAAGGAAAKGGLGGLLSGLAAQARGPALAAAAAAIAGGMVLKVREDLKSGFTGIVQDIPKWFNFGTLGFIAQSAQGWADLIVSKIRHPLLGWEDDVRHKIAGSWDQTRHDTASIWGSITGFLSGSWHKMLGDSGQATSGVRQNFSGMSDTILGAMRRAGQATDAFRTRNLLPVLGAAGRVSGGIQGLQHYIDLLHGKTVSVGAHLSGSGGVQVTPSTGAPGAKNYAVYFKPLATGGQVSGGTAGRDSVPAMLTPGEVVVPAPMVKAGAVNHLKGRLPGFAAGGLVGNLAADTGADVAGEAKAGLGAIVAAIRKTILQALVPSTGYIYRAGSGVQQWRGVVQQALGLAGANVAQLTDPVLYQMQTESGGNPTIVNRTDSNWLAGHPSVGLMQVIRGTYQAYAGRFRGTGPFEYGVSVNPLANVYAAIKYAQANYGPGLRNAYGGIGTGHGYDRGGWLPTGTSIAVNNTGRPEQVIPPGGTAAGGAVHLHLTVNGPVGSQSQLEDWFIRTANKTARHGRLSQAVKAASR